MKRLLTFLMCLGLCACGGSRYGSGIPETYDPLLNAALADCPRADSLRTLLRETPREEREAMAYLLAWMPGGDRDTMNLELLREDVAYACKAREIFPWTKELPDSIFLNEVLPYAVVDEVRDAWRGDFFDRFSPCVAGCRTLREAAEAVNRAIVERVGVEYNTQREKTNQSPAESMRQHMASCTGLSVLLVDALRAVGVPARFVGTAAWHDNRGNHSWTEVWFDGGWHFTEYYFPGYDRAWFLADAGQATEGDRMHAIYAVSFRPTGDWFPMVWNESSHEVHAEEVTSRYRTIYREVSDRRLAEKTHVEVRFTMYLNKAVEGTSAGRVAANVDVFCGAEQVGGGRTAAPQQDMNDGFRILLEKHKSYTFRYENARGEATSVTVEVGDEPLSVSGYME